MKKLVLFLATTLVWSLLPAVSGAATRPCLQGPDKSKRGLIEADVDGDELSDRVWLAGRRAAKWCRWYLVIDSSSFGKIRKRVKPADDYERWVLRNGVGPVALVEIDSVPGHEIALQLARGAAVGGMGLFTLREGIVHRMRVARRREPRNGVFLYGGSGSAIYSTDCIAGDSDRLISSYARPRNYEGQRKQWIVKRRWFQVEGTKFVWGATHKATVRFERIPRLFDEFAGWQTLLQNCEGVTLDD